MKDVQCVDLIVTDLNTRGAGVVGDPVRRITTVYTKEGEFVAEYDPSIRGLLEKFAATIGSEDGARLAMLIREMK